MYKRQERERERERERVAHRQTDRQTETDRHLTHQSRRPVDTQTDKVGAKGGKAGGRKDKMEKGSTVGTGEEAGGVSNTGTCFETSDRLIVSGIETSPGNAAARATQAM